MDGPGTAGGAGRELEDAIRAHCALFNRCVGTGDWAPFVATFTEDARMVVTAAPDRAIVGRDQIARLYDRHPPSAAMTIDEVEPVDARTARARFRWTTGGAGGMTVRWSDDQVAEVVLSGDLR